MLKKDYVTKKENYRPFSLLPAISGIFGNFFTLADMIFEDISLSLFVWLHTAQHALLALVEKWKSQLDKKGCSAVVLMDLSKAFDVVNHDLLLAKMQAYGFHNTPLALFKAYVTSRL